MLNPAISNLIKEMKKPCPFCGGSAHLWRWGRKFDKRSRQYAVKCYRCMTHSEPSEDPKQAVINWYNENFSEFQRNANRRLKKDEAHEDGALTIIYRILESASGVDGKSAVEKVKADIRAERGVQQ